MFFPNKKMKQVVVCSGFVIVCLVVAMVVSIVVVGAEDGDKSDAASVGAILNDTGSINSTHTFTETIALTPTPFPVATPVHEPVDEPVDVPVDEPVEAPTGDRKPITFNAAAPSSLGSSDCAAEIPVEDQTSGHFRDSIYCGAPRGNGNPRPACGKTLELFFNGRQTSCVIGWNAEDPNPRTDVAYVEIFARVYTELTGNDVVDDILWNEGMFDGECFGDCR